MIRPARALPDESPGLSLLMVPDSAICIQAVLKSPCCAHGFRAFALVRSDIPDWSNGVVCEVCPPHGLQSSLKICSFIFSVAGAEGSRIGLKQGRGGEEVWAYNTSTNSFRV